MKRIFLVVTLLLAGISAHAQHKIQVDNGAGAYGIFDGSGLPTGTTVFILPPTGGSLIVAPPPGTPSLAWLTAGNTLTGTAPNATERFGSTNAYDVIMMANNAEKMRLVSGGGVTISGSAFGINSLSYSWPASHGAGSRVLTNDGAGILTWEPAFSGVTTNATLSGNGTVGSPLGINLGNSNTWTANQTFAGTFLITANSRIAMTNSDNNARDLRLQEPSGTGSQYIGIRAPSVTNNGNYLLPAVMGSVGQVLSLSASNGVDSGTMAWSSLPTSFPPSGPAGGDLTGTYPNPDIAAGVIVNADINASAGIVYSKLSLTNSIQNSDIVANAITTSKVANGTVTTSKLADSAVSGLKLLTHAVTSNHIANGTIIDDDISPTAAIAYSKIAGTPSSLPPSGAAGGDLTGSYPNPDIAAGAVTNTEVAAGAGIVYSKLNLVNSIQNADIVANAITTSKVANGTVTTSKLADSAVSGLKLLTHAVTGNHIQDGTITDADVSPTAAIAYSKIAGAPTSLPPSGAAGGDLSGTYPNPDIAAGAIVNGDINAAAGIQYSKLTLTNSIQNSDIVANAITTSKVANGTVTTSKLADSAVSGLKLLTHAVTSNHIQDGTIATVDIADDAVAFAKVQNASTESVLIGRGQGGGGGDLEEITLGSGLTMTGTTLSSTGGLATVTHNATLSGNGTVGSPLGINLGNSNTWTANQTFSSPFLITANARIAMTNSDNNSRDLRIQEPSGSGTQYIGIRCPPVTNNGNYLWPAVVGNVGDVLSVSYKSATNDSNSLVWVAPSSTATVNTDITLTGDGSVGIPLGIDLTESNVWTATITSFTGFLESRNEPFVITNTDNSANEMRIQEASGNGSNFVALRADTSITTNDVFILPSDAASVGDVLTAAAVNTPSNRFTTMEWRPAPLAVFSGTTAINTVSGSFSSPNGDSHVATESIREVIIPRSGTIKNLYGWLTTAPGGTETKTITLRVNGASSALATTISGTSQSNSNTANTVSVTAGDRVCIMITHSASPAASVAAWGFELQ